MSGVSYSMLNIVDNRIWNMDQEKFNDIVLAENTGDIGEFIFDTFDFDFCKATYDGKKLRIHNPLSILKKECVYTGDKEALKYMNYHPNGMFTRLQRFSRLQSTCKKRMEKYTARGFTIVDKFDFKAFESTELLEIILRAADTTDEQEVCPYTWDQVVYHCKEIKKIIEWQSH